jgi:hypothetical protein
LAEVCIDFVIKLTAILAIITMMNRMWIEQIDDLVVNTTGVSFRYGRGSLAPSVTRARRQAAGWRPEGRIMSG